MSHKVAFVVPNSFSLNKLRGELKIFLKKSKFIFDLADLRKGTIVRVEINSRKEAFRLLGYCLKNNFVFQI